VLVVRLGVGGRNMGRNRGAHIGQALRALHTRKGTITCEDGVQTLSHFAQRVATLAAGLSGDGELQPGDRVAVASLNRSAFQITPRLAPVPFLYKFFTCADSFLKPNMDLCCSHLLNVLSYWECSRFLASISLIGCYLI
jgi:acyl-CoA synthetase (AMP-forming)/AMP-acid ligase II